MSKESVMSARAEKSPDDNRAVSETKRCHSQLGTTSEKTRPGSRNSARPTLTAYCSHCKLPLLIDITTEQAKISARASSSRTNHHVCNGCSQERVQSTRTPASRLYKSASVDWTNFGDKIETWFETARTPDQRIVYNFLEKINGVEKQPERPVTPPHDKSLDDILTNLKKYRTRFNSSNPQKRSTHHFESTSWRVMRHPAATTPRRYARFNTMYGDEASRDFHIGSVFGTTEPRIGSTFVLHPGWV